MLTESFVSINRRNNEARIHIAVRRFTDTNVCGPGSVKTWKTRHKISTDIRIFYSLRGHKLYWHLIFIDVAGLSAKSDDVNARPPRNNGVCLCSLGAR